jgi:glycolate oxidase iron-sulfur subunit
LKTDLTPALLATAEGREADRILRSCVHCGFCTAICPTYRLLGDERDSPRGRIYLIKDALEGEAIGASTQLHLDRCLTCRACETVCPSGVEYGRLLDIGRRQVEQRVPRSPLQRLARYLLKRLLPHPQRVAPFVRAAQRVRRYLPDHLKRRIPARSSEPSWPDGQHTRRVLLHEGCVQSVLAPQINASAARVLDRLGITAVRASGCCGAVSQHLGDEQGALAFVRANIDRWWPAIEQGCDAIISTASGCGVMLKDYGYLLSHDSVNSDRSAQIAARVRDIGELLATEPPDKLDAFRLSAKRVAFQSPCTLEHGQKLAGQTEALLVKLGLVLTPVTDSPLCCGSAGTYSMLQPAIARQLAKQKVDALMAGKPALIATANIGCWYHLRQYSPLPVRHWIELLDAGDETAR